MQDKKTEGNIEEIKQKIIHDEGWFVPSLHEKYLHKRTSKIFQD